MTGLAYDADAAVLDTLVLANLVARKVESEGGATSAVRAELERIWCEAAYVESRGNGPMTIVDNRAPVEVAQIAAQEAAVERATAQLRLVEAEAASAIQGPWERVRRRRRGCWMAVGGHSWPVMRPGGVHTPDSCRSWRPAATRTRPRRSGSP